MANSRDLNLTDGTLDLTLNEQDVVADHGLTFTGRGALDYGQHRNTNLLHLVEHFASDTPPTNPLTGQVWYDTGSNQVQVFDGAVFGAIGTDDFILSGTYVVNDVNGQVILPKSIGADVVIDNIASYTNFQNHINDLTGAHAASRISFDDTSAPFVATDVQEAIEDTQAELDTHLTSGPAPGDPSNNASAISFVPFGSIGSTDVQAAIEELEVELNVLQGNVIASQALIDNHISDVVDAHDASAISYDNTTSGLVAIDVQSAIDEISLGATTGSSGSGVIDYVRTQTTANQLISGGPGGGVVGTYTKLPFNTIVIGDTLGNFNTTTNTYVADRPMEVRIRAYGTMGAVGGSQYFHLRIRKNGTTSIRRALVIKINSSVGTADQSLEISLIEELALNDAITVEAAIQSFGGNPDRSVLTGRHLTGFEVEVLKDLTP